MGYKIIGNILEVDKIIPEEIIPSKVELKQYSVAFLKEQKVKLDQELANIVARQAKELEVAQANIDEVDTLLFEANKLGVVEMP